MNELQQPGSFKIHGWKNILGKADNYVMEEKEKCEGDKTSEAMLVLYYSSSP